MHEQNQQFRLVVVGKFQVRGAGVSAVGYETAELVEHGEVLHDIKKADGTH